MEADEQYSQPRRLGGRYWWVGRIAIAVLAFVVIAGTVAWFSRERIAGNVIDDVLAGSGLKANYDIVSIGPGEQTIENFYIGDEARPDLRVERIVAEIDYDWGTPQLGRITVISPRLYGNFEGGALSFGALDPAIFGEGEGGIPELDIKIEDARGLIETDFGRIAFKLDGEGILDDGFAAKLAATAPEMGVEGCTANSATAYGDLTMQSGLPEFSGPVRLRGLSCQGASLASADIAADLTTNAEFSKLEGAFVIAASKPGFADASGDALTGTAQLVVDQTSVSLAHDLAIEALATPYGGLEAISADGALRSVLAGGESEWSADVRGETFTPGETASALMSGARKGLAGTLLEPLLVKFTRNLDTQAAGASLAASVTVRSNSDGLAVIVPEGRITSTSGTPLLALSRLSWVPSGSGAFTGNFITGGEGLPQINGRMEQRGGGPLALRLGMAEYEAGPNKVAVPRMELRQSGSGDISFTGLMNASGDIPGGNIVRLSVPVSGRWSRSGAIMLGERCTTARFDALSLYDLSLGAQSVELCPEPGARAMLAYSEALTIGIAADDLKLSGELGGGPITVTSSGGALRYPAPFELKDVAVRIGEAGSGVDLNAASLTGGFNGENGAFASGTFTGGAASIDAVPLNFTEIAGNWRYQDEALILDESALVLTERSQGEVRFYPLIARAAKLTLLGNDISAAADLRHPGTGQLITAITAAHDLSTGAGQAALGVPGITFGEGLEPSDLTYLTKGVIANANGTIAGRGDISWTAEALESSGTFGTRDFDLAAAFGPVTGLSGDVRFTDLLALTTAPDQELSIGSVNPGIEVLEGKIVYSLTNGELVSLNDGRWPFMGGDLILRPAEFQYGRSGGQRFVFEIRGLDAAKFVAQMELTNLGATGVFDGAIPVEFDPIGNGQIVGGQLTSRLPGGNVAYIGELTYEDLGTMGNYAFQSLRNLEYSQMSIGLNGDLAGEIITSLSFDGVRQGAGTSQNFITKQLAKLPIRFNVNVRSQNFYQLATMVKSFWDPSLLGDALNRGALPGSQGAIELRTPENNPPPEAPAPALPDATRPDEPAVQVRESEEDL